MKNLKKVLALVLVVATLMGFATVAGAKTSDFTDAASIKNGEAVDVMTATGVIVGKPGGGFDPNGNVTRAEMAKMVSFIMNGGEDVGPLYSAANVFADCGYHWARGYIAYAANVKLIVGVGNNKFNPDGNVTGTEAAKMLLCALGYEADREGIKGSTWASKTLSLAKNVGLLKDFANSFDFSQPLSRDGAAQMMLNALKCPTVTYSDDSGSITTPDGFTVDLGGNRARYVSSNTASYRNSIGTGTVPYDENGNATSRGNAMIELGEKSFEGDLTLKGSTDAFGRPAHTWTYDREEIDTYTDTPDLTYTAEVKARDIYNDNGKVEVKANHVHVYTDGRASVAGTGSYLPELLTAIKSGNDDKFGGAGTLVEVYMGTEDEEKTDANGDKYTDTVDSATIVIINTYVAEIKAFNKAKLDKNGNVKDAANIELDFTDGSKPATGTVNKYETDDYTKDDEEKVVLYTVAFDRDNASKNEYNVQNVAYPETIDGTMSRFVGNEDDGYTGLTVAGTKYDVSAKPGKIESADEKDFDGTYTFYKDTYGNIIKAEVKEAGAANYVFLERVKEDSDNFEKTNGVKAYVVHTDGKHEVVSVDTYKNDDGKYVCDLPANGEHTVAAKDITKLSELASGDNVKDDGTVYLNTWISYTVNSKDEYTFKKIDDERAHVATVQDGDAYVLTEKKAGISNVDDADGHYLNSDTVVTNIDDDYKVTTFTGLPKRSAKFDAGTQLLITFSKNASAANAIYAAVQSKALSNDNVTYAYAVEKSATTQKDPEWKFVVDGKVQFYIDSDGIVKDADAGKIHDLTLTDDKIADADAKASKSGSVTGFGKGVISIGGTAYKLADDCKIYDVSDKEELPTEAGDAVDELTSLDTNDTVAYVLDNDEVVIIFRTALAPDEG